MYLYYFIIIPVFSLELRIAKPYDSSEQETDPDVSKARNQPRHFILSVVLTWVQSAAQ